MARRGMNAQHDFYLGGVLILSINKPPDQPYPRLDINPDKGIAGWHSTPDSDAREVALKVGRRGESPYPRSSRGKTLTYNLTAKTDWSGGEPEMNGFMDSLRYATWNRSDLGLLVATPWAAHGSDIWASFATVEEMSSDEIFPRGLNAVPSPFQSEVTLSFRQSDGIWFWANESGTFLTPMFWSASGVGAGVVVHNSGGVPTDPVITAKAVSPGDDLHIGRDLAGGGSVGLWFRDPVGYAGFAVAKDVVIEFTADPRKATVDGINVTNTYDASSSQWWDEFVPGVPPGDHNLWIGPGAGTGIEITLYSTSS